MNIKDLLQKSLIDAIKKLGPLGTISYVGAIAIFFVITQVNFQTDSAKGISLLVIGTSLLLFSGIIYWLEKKEEAIKIREALGVLREVYNRMAEQISTADKDKTVSITMTIDNLPKEIAEVIKKTSGPE